MNPRKIILAIAVVLLLTLTGLPDKGLKSLRADPPAPVRCGIIFPFFHLNSGSNIDTAISIAGDSTSLGEETPFVQLYFYNSSGQYLTDRMFFGQGGLENTQWTWLLSSLCIESILNSGYIVAITNLPQVEAACFIVDGATGAVSDAPAVVDYSIIGLDQNLRIVRDEAHTPPANWWDLDPSWEIDPSLHHTTLIFPLVAGSSGFNIMYDTTIVVRNTYYSGEQNMPAVTVQFFLYDATGASTSIPATSLGAGSFQLSEIAPGFSGGGWLVAHVNRPFALGCSFTYHYGCDYGYNCGTGATVDNNLYPSPGNWITPPIPEDRTSLIVPYVKVGGGIITLATLTNTVASGATAHFYLYGMGGDYICDWPHAIDACGMTLISFQGGAGSISIYIGETLWNTVSAPFNSAGYFAGWLLVTVDKPCAEGTVAIMNGSNALCLARAVIDNDITGVDWQDQIVRENPAPSPAITRWSIPYVQNDPWGVSTQAITVNTRNRSGFSGGAAFEHTYWSAGGYGPFNYSLPPYGCVGGGSLSILPGQVWPLSPGQGGLPFTVGRGQVETNTPGVVGTVLYEALGDYVLVSWLNLVGLVGKIINNTAEDMIIAGSARGDGDILLETPWHPDSGENPMPDLIVWITLWSGHKSSDYINDADVLILEAGPLKYGMSFDGGDSYRDGGGGAKIDDGTWLTLQDTFEEDGHIRITYKIEGLIGSIGYLPYAAGGGWCQPIKGKLEKQLIWANTVLEYGGLPGPNARQKFERLRDSAVSMLAWGRYYP